MEKPASLRPSPRKRGEWTISRLFGARIPRVEDARLLRGQGRFVGDIVLARACCMRRFLRQPAGACAAEGHRCEQGEGAARRACGVHLCRPAADCSRSDRIPLAIPAGAVKFHVDPIVLAQDELSYVGEPIALVVADSRAIAEDAAGADRARHRTAAGRHRSGRGARTATSPKARLDCPDNLVAQHVLAYGDVDAAFAKAAHRIAETVPPAQRRRPFDRAARACWRAIDADARSLLTVWDGTQMPHRAKAMLVACLGLAEHQVRVIAPDVGGGFGPKAVFHPEELAIPAAAMLLGRPVKWMEDRFENFTATALERDQDWDMEAAFDADGRLLAIRGHMRHDHGACTPYGVALPYNAMTNMIGPYVLPACHVTASLCLTNFTPAAPTRGAGRPQGTFVMERLLDRMAAKLGITRDEIRRRNLIPRERRCPTRRR